MSNINLAINEEKKISGKIFKSAQLLLIVILVLVIIAYGTLLFLVKTVNKNIEKADADYSAEKEVLIGAGNTNGEVLDLQKRIKLSKKLIENKNVEAVVLGELEKSMVDGVSLNSLEYKMDDNSVVIAGNADNLYSLAKQVATLNDSKAFSGIVNGVETNSGVDSGIDFSLKLKINNLNN